MKMEMAGRTWVEPIEEEDMVWWDRLADGEEFGRPGRDEVKDKKSKDEEPKDERSDGSEEEEE